MQKVVPNLVGQRFGKLVVIRRDSRNLSGKAHWNCRCDCGGSTISSTGNLRSGTSSACRDCGTKKHGHTWEGGRTPTYSSWISMKSRCLDPNASKLSIKNYQNKGITICKQWAFSFENFLQDIGERPSAKHSIDRIDNTKGYYPGNCRWATHKQQMRNQSRNNLFEIDGRKQCISAWAEELGISHQAMKRRIKMAFPKHLMLNKGPLNRWTGLISCKR